MTPAVSLQIDDSVILATDDAGADLCRFEVVWNGAVVHVRYPTYGQWDNYCRDVAMLLRTLGTGADDIDLPEDGTRPALWAELKSWIMVSTGVRKRVESIFFDYLRPEMECDDGAIVKGEKLRQWLGDNAPIDAAVRMFCALFTPQDMLKKNATYHLTKIFPALMGQLSKPTVTKTGDGQNGIAAGTQYSNSISF